MKLNKALHVPILVLLLTCSIVVSLPVEVAAKPDFPVHNIDTELDYAKIQEAIDAPETLDGHTIQVDAGIYYENVVVNKTVSLIGENKNTAIIDGNLTGYVVWVKANKVTIKGFTIRRSGTYNGVSLGVFLDHSNNSKISGNIIISNGDGILLVYTCNSLIYGNIVTDNARGIRLHHFCNNNTLYENRVTDNLAEGIHIFGASNNNLIIKNMIKSIAKHPINGISISDYCRYNVISGNTITSNEAGIELLFTCEHNVLTGNTVTDNMRGIRLHVSDCNNIYHNNFINHTIQVSTYRSYNNTWDNGYPSGGNYWSDHTGVDMYGGSYQNETGSDGIGDTSYVIDENNQDSYPLMGMFSDFNATVEHHVTTICDSIISDFEVDYRENMMSFTVTNERERIGFCRIMIPRSFMEGPYAVIIDEEIVNATELPVSNSTHAFLYFIYTHSTHMVTVVSSKLLYFYYQLLYSYIVLLKNFNSLNSTYYELLDNYDALNASCQELLLDYSELQGNCTHLWIAYDELQDQYNSLNSSYNELQQGREVIIDELGNIRNLMYIFIALTIIFVVATTYLIIRQSKAQPEIKTK